MGRQRDGRGARAVIGVALALAVVGVDPGERAPATAASAASVVGRVCLPATTTADLDRLFDTEPGGLIGADYPRAVALGDGRVLWLFQDGAVRVAPDRIEIVHSVAMLQDGNCFDVYHGGTRAEPLPFLFPASTEPYSRWYWPLDAEVGSDGRIYAFVTEMEERGDAYLTEVWPVATWVAVIDPVTLAVVDERPAPNPSADLYGWSITSDDRWTYLYGQCYRQFGFDRYVYTLAFDRECSPNVTVGRVPRGRLLDAPQYWDGARWQPDPDRAVPVIATKGRRINADQIEWTGWRFLSVNKEGDWWGDTVLVSASTSPTGPFRVFAEIPAVPKCADCNTFFANWIPPDAVDRRPAAWVYALSHNRWDGAISAFYRPTFQLVAVPTSVPAGGVVAVSVPDGVGRSAVMVNVTAVRAAGRGFVTAFACDRSVPDSSSVNFVAGEPSANLVVVRPDGAGRVCLFVSAETDLVVDAVGSFEPGDVVVADVPTRIVDTRIGLGTPT